MKRILALILTALLMVSGLSGCGCDDGRNVGLVFVNDSDATIIAVMADFGDHTEGSRNADFNPLKRGDSLSFQSGEYPVTVVVYEAYEDLGPKKELARVTIPNAPPEGKRWYVTAWDCAHGVVLTGEPCWPEGVGLEDMIFH